MYDIKVPKANTTDATYTLIEWLVPDGATVTDGMGVAIVETSKATEEIAAVYGGVLRQLVSPPAELRPGDVIGQLASASSADQAAPVPKAPAGRDDEVVRPAIVITEPARLLAEQHGIDEQRLRLAGKKIIRRQDVQDIIAGPPAAGRITHDADAQAEPSAADRPRIAELPAAQRAVASQVARSHRTIAPAFTVIKLLAEPIMRAQAAQAVQAGSFVGLTEQLVKAVAALLPDFPLCFAAAADETEQLTKVRLAAAANIGVTIDIGSGLFIPVVRNAAELSLLEIARELMRLRARALRNQLRERDFQDANIVVSLNTEPDVVLAVPVILPGTSCTVSLGSSQEELFMDKSRTVGVRRYFYLGCAYDHRVVNGREAMRFLRSIKEQLEA
jgi:2-oxoglutarate dehydrogenase E2 component (dihydrolipoamide succinyltransferase)